MTRTFEVVYDGQVFRPDGQPDIPPDTRCRISIEELRPAHPTGDVWKLLESMAGSIEAPEDWALEHDHYLYGTPKTREERG